jgi:hypothetical protein
MERSMEHERKIVGLNIPTTFNIFMECEEKIKSLQKFRASVKV